MQKIYNFRFKVGTTLKSAMLLSFLFVALAFQKANAQSNIVVDLSFGSFKSNYTAHEISKNLNAESNFTIKNGCLDEVKSFALKMNLFPSDMIVSDPLTNDSLAFELTHVMVLPYMGLVHIVGNLEVEGVSKRTELDFKYSVNEDESLTLSGTKQIKLSDYKKVAQTNASNSRISNEINLVFNLLLKNNQPSFIAAK